MIIRTLFVIIYAQNMKITYTWLKELVKFNYSPDQLAEHLTMLGLEVELVVPVKPLFSGVIIGKILEIVPHPNSKKLLLCKVSTRTETLQIICGANNIQVGDLVPTAAIGAILADNTNIIKRNIMGIDSYGMLCSEKELGLHDSAQGILILSKENTNGKILKIGSPLEKALSLEDTVLDINVTPNRPDALSIIGIAREISALTGNPVVYPQTDFTESAIQTKELVKINVHDPKYCPRYTARIIRNIQVKPSPFWMRYRLGMVGIRSINNIVDMTNYVLIELGQPLHAFDYNSIKNASVIIRTAEHDEQIVTIDNESKKLDKDMLVIADTTGPIAIAGVMGGKETEVGDKTTDILLESAYFEPTNIRRTSKKLGLSTEASYRFERSIDTELSPLASNRAAHLIQSLTGGIITKGMIDCKKNMPKPPRIKTTPLYYKRILGVEIPAQKINSILKGLGCLVKKYGNSTIVTPPTWRPDIQKEIDLAEEVARVYGYSKISSTMPEAMVNAPKIQKTEEVTRRIYGLLTGMGLSETITYSFINPKDISTLKLPEQTYITLANPIDKNTCIMRPTLIPAIINTIIYNFNRNADSIHIFETGRCFFRQNGANIREEMHLAIGLFGNPKELHWRKNEQTVDFFYIKGIIEELLNKLFIQNYQLQKAERETFYPGKACDIIIQNKKIGVFGELHPQIARDLDFKDANKKIYIAELNLELLIDLMPSRYNREKFQPLPKFPSIRRDISIILDKGTESYAIINLVKEINSDIIEDVKLFDVYEGPSIPEGKKSIAYAIIYRHKDRTLTDEEVDNIHNLIRQNILEKLQCEIRE